MESAVWDNPVYLKVWMWCLLRACHKDTKIFFNCKELTLKRGQFISGLYKASDELKISPQQFRSAITTLEHSGMISKKSTNKFTVYNVVKYNDFQTKDIFLTNQQQTSNKPATTYKNVKNVKNIYASKRSGGLRQIKDVLTDIKFN